MAARQYLLLPGQAGNSNYTVTATTGVKDIAGNPMTGNYQFSYTTSGDIPLQSGVPKTGSVSQDEWVYYYINSSATDTELEVTLTDLSNDVDLYVRAGAKPTLTSYNCRPYSGGTTSEVCRLPNNGDTLWYIGVNGYSEGSYKVTATLLHP